MEKIELSTIWWVVNLWF